MVVFFKSFFGISIEFLLTNLNILFEFVFMDSLTKEEFFGIQGVTLFRHLENGDQKKIAYKMCFLGT